jgi:hypothetical protein
VEGGASGMAETLVVQAAAREIQDNFRAITEATKSY